MVRAWYMDDSSADQRLPHEMDPPQNVDLEFLNKIGVLYFKVDADTFPNNPELAKIRTDRGYTYEDLIEIQKDKLPNYDEKLKMFFTEHLHADEEIRYCVDGSGYFDVRDQKDRWIRIMMEKDDLVILPAGIYHRFTLDTKDYIKAARYFVGEPVWTPHNRPADDMNVRKQYVESIAAVN